MPRRAAWLLIVALCLGALTACGMGPQVGIRQWALTLPHVRNLEVVGSELAVTSGTDLWVSPLAAWRPERIALSPGENCALTGLTKPTLVCLVPSQGGTTVLVQPSSGQGLAIADLVSAVQTMSVVADPGFVVVETTFTGGSQQTVALDLASQAVVTLSLPPGRPVGLDGATYLAEVSGIGGNQNLIGVSLPSGVSHTLAALPAPLLHPMLAGGWVFGFPLTSQPSVPRFDAYSASGGQLAHLALPAGLLGGQPYAVGPGYVLVTAGGSYQVFLAAAQVRVALGLAARPGDLVGTNGQDVAYVLTGHTLHLFAVPAQLP